MVVKKIVVSLTYQNETIILKLRIMSTTKKINGKTFNFATREFNTEFANKKANELRTQGFYARVIKDGNTFPAVYVCQK